MRNASSAGLRIAAICSMRSFSTVQFARQLLVGLRLILIVALTGPCIQPGNAQLPSASEESTAAPEPSADEEAAPGKVEVNPEATDVEIQSRLQRILETTEWYTNPQVRVDQGVAFLSGETNSDTRKKWAGDLARNTRDVVAVVNKITLTAPPMWDLEPAVTSVRNLWHDFLRKFPLVLIAAVVLVIAWFTGRAVTVLMRHTLTRRDNLSRLLREVLARAVGVGVFLLGLYLVLVVIGLARLAITVLGGTGLIGLVLGIAFRDITENFLASIFLSIQRPFRTGDLVEIENMTGYVQRLTVRTTVLMSPEGNHLQIPNSTVYKNTIRNFTSNPNRRESFTVGIGYDDPVSVAQQVAMNVLENHPAVLREPKPWVLVDKLGPATVDLKIYFWLDGTKHSFLKVRSSVIRLIKRAFQAEGISMPDEAREVIINKEVPLALKLDMQTGDVEDQAKRVASTLAVPQKKPEGEKAAPASALESAAAISKEEEAVSTSSEGGLDSEAAQMEEQAARTRIPEEGEDLLK